jgi:hypothetical protein
VPPSLANEAKYEWIQEPPQLLNRLIALFTVVRGIEILGTSQVKNSANFAFWGFCEVRLQDVEYRSLEIVRPFEYLSALSDA